MERCAAPPPEPLTRTEIEVETGDTEETTKDAYECRICGYKAIDVKRFSQHLHAAHPVTSFPETSSLRSDRCNTQEEERGGVDDDDDDDNNNNETACLIVPRTTPANNKVSMSACQCVCARVCVVAFLRRLSSSSTVDSHWWLF